MNAPPVEQTVAAIRASGIGIIAERHGRIVLKHHDLRPDFDQIVQVFHMTIEQTKTTV